MDTATTTSTAPVTTPRRLWPKLWRTVRGLVKQPLYRVYERRLAARANQWKLPRHIGIIMDGNRRFARQLGLSAVSDGHARGADRLWDVLSWCYDVEIPVVTVWGFSLENFQRPKAEVDALFELFEIKTREMVRRPDVHENRIRIRFIGKRELLPESLRSAIIEAETVTADYDQYQLNIAIAYGGRQEITEAFRDYLRDHAEEGKSLADVLQRLDDRSIEPYLYTSGLPEPDLILRTSGEERHSGFLLWQSAYSEFYFSDTHWPAFRKIDLLRALRSYSQRQRRLGR